jgi:hypothetical protein
MEEVRRFVGVDVAKARLDVFIQPSGESFSVANDERGARKCTRTGTSPSGLDSASASDHLKFIINEFCA